MAGMQWPLTYEQIVAQSMTDISTQPDVHVSSTGSEGPESLSVAEVAIDSGIELGSDTDAEEKLESESDQGLLASVEGPRKVDLGRPRGGVVLAVTSMAECFEWAEECLLHLRNRIGEDLYRRLACRGWTVSTDSKALASVNVALQQLKVCFSPIARAPLHVIVTSFRVAKKNDPMLSCEQWSDVCAHHGVFGRIMVDEDRHKLTSEMLRERFKNALVADAAHCMRHRVWCRVSRATMEVSVSTWRGCEKMRAQMQEFHAWARIMRHDRPYIIIHQSLLAFPAAILKEELGDLYDFQRLQVQPSHAGFGFIHMHCQYDVGALRSSVSLPSLQSVYSSLVQCLTKDVSDWPQWVWQATESELEAAKAAQSNKRGSWDTPCESEEWQEVAIADPGPRCNKRPRGEWDADGELEIAGGTSLANKRSRSERQGDSWELMLTIKERANLRKWTQAWWDHHGSAPEESAICAFDLSVEGSSKKGFSLHRRTLPTMRGDAAARPTKWWSPSRGRWLLPPEIMACMGFPVYPHLANVARVP